MENTAVNTPETQSLSKPKRNWGLFVAGSLILVLAHIIFHELSFRYLTLLTLGIVYGLVLLGSGLSLRQAVLYMLVAYLPFGKQIGENFGHFGSAFNFTNILVGLAAASWIFGKNSEGEVRFEKTSLNLPLFIFIAFGMISIFRFVLYGRNYLSDALVDYAERWGVPILLYFIAFHNARDKRTIQNLVILMMTAVVVIGVMASLEYMNVRDKSPDASRVRIITDDPNLLSAFFNYYMFLFLGFLLVHIRRIKYWSLAPFFLISVRGMMVTFSRAGYLACTAALAAMTFVRSKVAFILLVFAAWFVWQNPVLLPAGIRYRMGQTFTTHSPNASLEESLDPSAEMRLRIWKGALWMIKDHPWFGIGGNLFKTKISAYWSGGGSVDAHNSYILLAAEMGIPALVVFLWILGAMFWHSGRLYGTTGDLFAKSVALGFMGGIAGFIVSNFFGSRLDSAEVSSYFWILAALIMRLKVLDKKEKELNEVTERLQKAT